MNPAIGLVLALPAEARALLGRGVWERADGKRYRRIYFKEGMSLMAVLGGIGQENAMASANWLLSRKVRALVSLGVAGGLDPSLKAGEVVFGDTVYQDQGTHYQRVWEGMPGIKDVIRERLQKRGMRGCSGGIVSVKKPVLSASAKKKLHVETGALATDMETGSVALVASESGIPFFAFRTICDPAGREIRDSFFRCLDPDGQIKVSRIIFAILRSPLLISDLLTLKRDFQSALTGLHYAWHKGIREMLPLLISKEEEKYLC
jgi:adenosylhomocysteine nucleosidase